jgi:hypothetical protein
MSKCFILGAGASYGYDETIPENDRPPLGNQVIGRTIKLGMLSEDTYPSLFKTLELYKSSNGLGDNEIVKSDIELVLEWAVNQIKTQAGDLRKLDPTKFDEEASKLLPGYREEMEKYIEEDLERQLAAPAIKDFAAKDQNFIRDYKAKRAEVTRDNFRSMVSDYIDNYQTSQDTRAIIHRGIGQAWYMMFELFRHYSLKYRPNFDAYQRLVLYHLRENYSVISLNYDTIFEKAVTQSGLVYSYPLPRNQILPYIPNLPIFQPQLDIWPDSSKLIYIAKIHGSVNWFNPVINVISVGSEVKDLPTLIEQLGGLPYTNRFISPGPLIRIPPDRLQDVSLRDLLPNGHEFYEPVLLPPIGYSKDYAKFDYVHRNFEAARQLLSSSDEIVIVGSSLRAQDKDLIELIKNNSKTVKKVTIVSPSHGENIKSSVKELLSPNDVRFQLFDSFENYVKTF